MPDSSDVQREIEAEARRLFPGAVRRVEWLGYGDAPVIEPGEILPQFVLAEPGPRGGDIKRMIKAFQEAHQAGPATVPARTGPAVAADPAPRSHVRRRPRPPQRRHDPGLSTTSTGSKATIAVSRSRSGSKRPSWKPWTG